MLQSLMSPFVGQEGDLKLTQSMAIVRHLARKFSLVGQTEAECARADMIVDQLGDYRSVGAWQMFLAAKTQLYKP